MNFLQNIFSNLFPQVQQAEQNLQTVGVIVAAWGLVIALELVLVIMLLARKR